jgi:hypothetical protein
MAAVIPISNLIKESVGFQARREIIRYDAIFRCFKSASDELLRRIKQREEQVITTEDSKYLRGEHSFDLIGRTKSNEDYNYPIIEIFIWYLCNIYALRDYIYHLDKFVNEIKGNSQIKDKSRDFFEKSGVRAFLQDLRNMYLHGSPFFPTFNVSFSRDENGIFVNTNRYILQKRQLLEYGDWKESKEYLESWKEDQQLTKVIEEYSMLVYNFDSWLREYYDSIFMDDYNNTDKLIHDWRKS